MARLYSHHSSPAKSGPPREPSRPPAAPPPPKWRSWLIVAGIVITGLLLFGPTTTSGPAPTKLDYTQFVNDVTANKVATAVFGSTNSVSGKLTSGISYTSQTPVGLDNPTL